MQPFRFEHAEESRVHVYRHVDPDGVLEHPWQGTLPEEDPVPDAWWTYGPYGDEAAAYLGLVWRLVAGRPAVAGAGRMGAGAVTPIGSWLELMAAHVATPGDVSTTMVVAARADGIEHAAAALRSRKGARFWDLMGASGVAAVLTLGHDIGIDNELAVYAPHRIDEALAAATAAQHRAIAQYEAAVQAVAPNDLDGFVALLTRCMTSGVEPDGSGES